MTSATQPQAASPASVSAAIPRHEGILRLLHLSGANITSMDLASALGRNHQLDLERLSQLALTLSLEPEFVRRPLGELILESANFVFELADGTLRVFVPDPHGVLTCMDALSGLAVASPSSEVIGRALVMPEAVSSVFQLQTGVPSWTRIALSGSENMILSTIGLTLVSNLLGLALPLFTLAIYDQVLASKNISMLVALVSGLGLAITADFSLRMLRGTMLARASALIDLNTGSALFKRILRAPAGTAAGMTSRLGLMRLRDLDLVRTFFMGPIGIACIDLPFSIFYFVVLALIGGWLAIVPLAMLVVGGGLLLLALGPAARRGRLALQQSEEYGNACNEIAIRFDAIKLEGEAAWWMSRFRDASARLAQAEMTRQRSLYVTQLASSILIALTVAATLGTGALLAIDGQITVGAMIASIALVWRVTAPMPSLLQARLRWYEVKESLAGTNAILATEVFAGTDIRVGGHGRNMGGRIGFSSVMMSYQRGQTAAIRNLSFEIAPGELTVVTGHSGAGKSTLLDLIAGIVEPQFGAVTIDGVNPQQISPSVLRQSLGYFARDTGALPLQIHDYLDIGVDEESRNHKRDVCDRLGILQQIEALPAGFETLMSTLDPSCGLVRAIGLARVLCAETNLILLDEPDASSVSARRALLSEIEGLRGSSTIVLVTHEPEFVAVADRVLVLSQGSLIRDCSPSDLVSTKQAVSA